jgi:YD repeat-containing protein
MGWSLTKLDQNGRVTNLWSITGAAQPWPFGGNGSSSGMVATSYSAQTTTVTDQAGVQRMNTVDGLGRLLQVAENGISATTSYGYDTLGNLASVTPASGNGRSFVYDSLSRLKSATNPESGATTYLYDNASNLTQRTDGRGIASTLIYDALNRLTTRQYSDFNSVGVSRTGVPCATTLRRSKSISRFGTEMCFGVVSVAIPVRRSAARMRAISSSVLKGFDTKSSAPASSASTLSLSESRTVDAISRS